MKVRAIKLKIVTAKGDFGFNFEFGRGLTVIRGKNSSGKSTLLTSLMYGLGMEEVVGGRGEKVLPYAARDYFLYGEMRVAIESSEVLVEVENSRGRCVTLRRAIRHATKSSKLVEVFEGSHLTSGIELGTPLPTYLFDAGSAQKHEGFFQFLESFLGLQLPQVAATSGGTTKLYIQTIFAALSVEQKRGWTDYIANIPFFGIRDARLRVTEFLLALGVFERQATRASLDADSLAIDADWRKAYGALNQAATTSGLLIQGLSATPTSALDSTAVAFLKSNGKTQTPLTEYVGQLRAEHAELGARAEAYEKGKGSEALKVLEAATAELQQLSVLHERASIDLTLQKASLDELRNLLAEVNEDLDRNKTALKLRALGAEMEIDIATDRCPTCHQSVEDTLLLGFVSGPQMDLNTNIGYLDSQRRMLQNQINGALEEIRQSEMALANVAARLVAAHDYKNSLRGDVGTGATESRAIVRRQIQIELELSYLRAFEEQAATLLEALGEMADRLSANRTARSVLPKDIYSTEDRSRISLFEKYFRSNAGSFGYESAEIDDIRISLDTLTPILADLELREIRSKAPTSLTADSSASDFVRLIWSYLLALYQTSSTRGFVGNHPGLLVLDEPGQHSMRSSSQRALLQLLSGATGLQAIVAASFDENESVFREATAGVEYKLIQWEGKVIRPLVGSRSA